MVYWPVSSEPVKYPQISSALLPSTSPAISRARETLLRPRLRHMPSSYTAEDGMVRCSSYQYITASELAFHPSIASDVGGTALSKCWSLILIGLLAAHRGRSSVNKRCCNSWRCCESIRWLVQAILQLKYYLPTPSTLGSLTDHGLLSTRANSGHGTSRSRLHRAGTVVQVSRRSSRWLRFYCWNA